MKTTITINAINLAAAKAHIAKREDRESSGVDIHLVKGVLTSVFPAVHSKSLDGNTSTGIYTFETDDQSIASAISARLDDLGIKFETVSHSVPTRVEINVLDLLDTQWMIYQMIDEPKLRITRPDGRNHYVMFVNDGNSLVATHSLIGHDAADGEELLKALCDMGTKHELQPSESSEAKAAAYARIRTIILSVVGQYFLVRQPSSHDILIQQFREGYMLKHLFDEAGEEDTDGLLGAIADEFEEAYVSHHMLDMTLDSLVKYFHFHTA